MTDTKKKAAFAKGDRVAWDHVFSTDHAAGSIVREEAVAAKAPNARFGVVQGTANDEGTWFEVLLDGDKTPTTLTEDELVKVAD